MISEKVAMGFTLPPLMVSCSCLMSLDRRVIGSPPLAMMIGGLGMGETRGNGENPGSCFVPAGALLLLLSLPDDTGFLTGENAAPLPVVGAALFAWAGVAMLSCLAFPAAAACLWPPAA